MFAYNVISDLYVIVYIVIVYHVYNA